MVIKNKIKKNIKVINIKKIFIIIISFFILSVSLVFANEGDDTEIGISTCEELQNMKGDLSLNYKLTQNIDCSDTINWNNGKGFIPIGAYNSIFTGNFDGQNFTISNLYINRIKTSYVGLFGFINNSIIKNVNLINFSVIGKNYVGGLVGIGIHTIFQNNYATGIINGKGIDIGGLVGNGNSGTFKNNFVNASVVGKSEVGGLAGYGGNSVFTNNLVFGTTNGKNYIGGLVGGGPNTTYINNSVVGNINGTEIAGGLVGFGRRSIYKDNHIIGNVNGNDKYIGGLVGFGTSTNYINNYIIGNVRGNDYVGGLVGLGTLTTFTNNYVKGNVRGNDYVGGLVGQGNVTTFTNNFATGSLSGNNSVGGLLGYGNVTTFTNNFATGSLSGNNSVGGLVGGGIFCSVTDSYYDTNTTGQTNLDCGEGKTTSELQTPIINSGIYSGWNSNIWNFGTSSEYPIFRSDQIKISTCEQLQNINQDISDLPALYILTQNIDCSDTINWNNGKGFIPIGSLSNQFNGNFDGQNFIISNLYINRSSEDNIGLFGHLNSEVVIENVGLVDVEIYGNDFVGGLVGFGFEADFTNNYAIGSVSGNNFVGGILGTGKSSTFTNNYVTGSVSGNDFVGGFVGLGTVTTFTNNYATGSVSGNDFVGGIVGVGTSSTFTNNFATGSVSGNSNVGGLIGTGTFCSATDSYYDTQTSGRTDTNCGSLGKTTSELQTPTDNTGIYSNWDLNIWNFGTANEYPIFNWQERQTQNKISQKLKISHTEISTCGQLQDINQNLSAEYTLISNIDCSDSINWNGGKGFEPIGSSSNKFKGNFDGQNFNISNLYINRGDENNVGLFGYLNSGVVIKNLGLVDVEVYGNNSVGGIAGNGKSATFTNNYVTGSVSGEGYIGGLVGSGGLTIFTNNFAKVSVSGSDFVGGLAGAGYKAIFTNNFAIEGVSGNKYVGGLVGGGYKSTFTNNFATGSVSGNSNVGGIIGAGTFCTATSSYYNTQTTGQTNSGCGEGKTTSELQIPTNNTGIYTEWNINVWNFGTADEYPKFNS